VKGRKKREGESRPPVRIQAEVGFDPKFTLGTRSALALLVALLILAFVVGRCTTPGGVQVTARSPSPTPAACAQGERNLIDAVARIASELRQVSLVATISESCVSLPANREAAQALIADNTHLPSLASGKAT
jgi:hypothetical protein